MGTQNSGYYTYHAQQVEPAQVSFGLSRIAQENAGSVAPNAVEVGDLTGFTQQDDAGTSGAEQASAPSGAARPVTLIVGRARNAKELVARAKAAGMFACLAVAKEKRFDAAARQADQTVVLGEEATEALFTNAYTVLKAAGECSAKTVLLADAASPLGSDQVFLKRAQERGMQVFQVLATASPEAGWVLREPPVEPLPPERWYRCAHCGLFFDQASVEPLGYVCPACTGLMRIGSRERLAQVADAGSFQEWDAEMPVSDPLSFPGYSQKLQANREKSGCSEAVCTGRARIGGIPVAIGVMEPAFLMGSMGHVVGQKVSNLVDRATEEGLPVVVFCASGGARMQEGLVSLMQMAKVSCALERHARAGLLYVSVLTDPTTGGVTASFAMQADIILAEPKALIGFAGQRVIRDTIRQELPEGFQTAEFALEHGLIDAIVQRADMRTALMRILMLHVDRKLLVEDDDPMANPMPESVADRISAALEAAREEAAHTQVEAAPIMQKKGLRQRLFDWAPMRDLRGSKAMRRVGVEGTKDPAPESPLDAVRKLVGGKSEEPAPAAQAPSAWDRVQTARNVHRPTARTYIQGAFDDFFELHGDRMFADDGAILAGIGLLDGMPVTVVAQEKGTDLNDRIARNFGCPQPEGYRKTLRLMRQAEKFGRPIVCLVDTQGAFCGTEAEERGQGNALADNLIAMAGLKVPVVSVLLGEGGSGGALALAVSNEVAIQENAVYSVLSPEGFASILWKDRSRAAEAAQVMGMAASDVASLGVADCVLSEGDGPAHENPQQAVEQVRTYLQEALGRLSKLDASQLVKQRQERFAAF